MSAEFYIRPDRSSYSDRMAIIGDRRGTACRGEAGEDRNEYGDRRAGDVGQRLHAV